MRIIVVTGISGSGKSVALNVLADSGYFCIDNLPPELLVQAAHNAHARGVTRLAVAIDIRSFNGTISALSTAFTNALAQLKDWQTDVRLLFLSASDATLIARYSETRRRHPLSDIALGSDVSGQPAAALSLEDCIRLERSSMSALTGVGHVIDTSSLTVAALRHSVRQFAQATGAGLMLTFESFGFKYGIPQDADLVFDARCLPNPHYEPALKALTGMDAPVMEYLRANQAVGEFIDDIAQFLSTWLPRYALDGRNYLTIGIGCTGGQHRSVYVVEQLAALYAGKARVLTRHRQQADRQSQQQSNML